MMIVECKKNALGEAHQTLYFKRLAVPVTLVNNQVWTHGGEQKIRKCLSHLF